MLFCDRHGEQCYYGTPENASCWCCEFRKWVNGESTDPRWEEPKNDDWITGTIYETPEWRGRITARRGTMSVPGFHEIDLVLSGVSIMNDAINSLRQHSLEMAVNAFSKRSVQCDLEKIAQTAEQIREAAVRLTTMSAEVNRELPQAAPLQVSAGKEMT